MGDNNQKKTFGGFFSSSQYDQPMNVPVTSGPAGSIMSPYLNFDPKYLPSNEDQFIFPEGAGRHRGRFELAFSQIGGSVFAGGAVGTLNGVYAGYKEIRATPDMSTSVKRTQMLNYVAKRGASSAQSLGVIALLYSLTGVGLQLARGSDDEWNTLTAATFAGLVYKSPGGLKKSLVGGAVGLSLATAYVMFMKSRTVESFMTRDR